MHTRLRQKESQEKLYISCQKTGKKKIKTILIMKERVQGKKTWIFCFFFSLVAQQSGNLMAMLKVIAIVSGQAQPQRVETHFLGQLNCSHKSI